LSLDLEGLEHRRLPVVNFLQAADVLTITGDGGNNNVVITDDGTNGNNFSATGDGAAFVAGSHVPR